MATKNLTVTLGEAETKDLDFLIDYYQQQSISTVTKTDVIKFMIKQTKKHVEEKIKEKNEKKD